MGKQMCKQINDAMLVIIILALCAGRNESKEGRKQVEGSKQVCLGSHGSERQVGYVLNDKHDFVR